MEFVKDNRLEGRNYVVRMSRGKYHVSPAVYELLSDPDVRDIVWEQLEAITEREFRKIIIDDILKEESE